MTRFCYILVLLVGTFLFGCSSAPEKADAPVVEKKTDKLEPSAEKLADCPCGDADWSKPPPGASVPTNEEQAPASESVE